MCFVYRSSAAAAGRARKPEIIIDAEIVDRK